MKKKIFLVSLIFIIFFLFLEILSIVFYPELSKNQIHKYVNRNLTISKSKNIWFKKFPIADESIIYRNHKNTSDFYNDLENIKKRKNNVFLFGDSVAGGFGVNFQETFFHYAETLINDNFDFENKIKIYSTGLHGHNLRNIKNGLNKLSQLIKKNDIVIYQFNYNDIVRHNYAPKNYVKPEEPSRIVIMINDFRKSFLNHSTFFRLLQHKAGNIKWKLQKISSIKNIVLEREFLKKCGNLGFTSLGQYTFSYGAKQFEDEALEIWNKFENDLIELNNFIIKQKLNFAVIISPISLQVPYHQKINARDLNFDCSTIDARKKIINILSNNSISIIDPTDDFIEYAEMTNQNNNSNFLFHPYDTNHPNEFGHYLMGKKLYNYLNNTLK